MRFKFNRGVDAGNICLADVVWLRRQGAQTATPDIEVPPGVYDAVLTVPQSWRGRRSVKGRMTVGRKGLYCGDLCYPGWSDKDWDSILGKTDYLREVPATMRKRLLAADTGGDGMFKVVVTLKKVIV